ncbi:hypothetical protein OGR47_11585 [Methylocystis sp. MJC1]|uniref:hypothetical protein n=1 Tax=Methylocystis sp. MJC1 TaxID=2654282 RepID=UPI0013E9B71B|nr:hypothetical protein [Methylocystis sp. MJC1]KAF2990123.1 hypothetical protein MJC1_02783 [Methylocystis sp. MJC1]MBU6527621.1 hypothetical protein [Methylocystis sp. MJC1]UZX10562.1 hypothetical protein OGR47_11585 [Methylocystis sp. MJC1]
MAMHRQPSRGLSDLRTLTGRTDKSIPAHKAYLRMSFLELERARRSLELRAATDRSDAINARFREIDKEIAEITTQLNGTAPPAQPVTAVRKSPVGMRHAKRRFSFTY